MPVQPPTPSSSKTPSIGGSSSRDSIEAVRVSAYLRIRPAPTHQDDFRTAPISNVNVLSSTEACMSAPSSESANTMPRSSSMSSFNLAGLAVAGASANPSTVYTFDEVFPDSAGQASLYSKTALPLVCNLLGANDTGRMENALIFAYGVSGGGKTHTVQGTTGGEPGLLPRALDTVMNSVAGKQTRSHLRPCRLTGLEIVPLHERTLPGQKINTSLDAATVRKTLLSGEIVQLSTHDQTTFSLPDQYEYSVWASYAEVYNEKIFDLFDPNEKRKALSLKTDRQAGNKYIQGLKEIRIWSNEDAQRLLRDGQVNRHVFATRINGASSRSHSIFTIKVVRLPKNADSEDPAVVANVSRLSVVDLAGSERGKNTDTKGDRLKEAGNINKSLMVLGQCMEVMRRNQEDRIKGKKAAIVPFRHSKLTELFQSFFSGDGRAVLIAAINPYTTSYEENLSVLRFAAVASKVTTQQTLSKAPSSHAIAQLAVPRYQQPLQPRLQRQPSAIKGLPVLPSLQEDESVAHEPGFAEDTLEYDDMPQTPCPDNEVDYEEGELDVDDDDAEMEDDAWEEALLEEIRHLRRMVVQQHIERESAIELALYKARVEMEKEIDDNDKAWKERMEEEIEQQEIKMNRKIDILVNANQLEMDRCKEAMAEAHQADLQARLEEQQATMTIAHQAEMAKMQAEHAVASASAAAAAAASTSRFESDILGASRANAQQSLRRSMRGSTAGQAGLIPQQPQSKKTAALASNKREKAVEVENKAENRLASEGSDGEDLSPIRKTSAGTARKLAGRQKAFE